MSNLGLTQDQQQDVLQGMHPITPEDVAPGALAGLWKAPFTGMASVLSDIALLGASLPDDYYRAEVMSLGIDAKLSDQDIANARKAYTKGVSEAFAPDPRTSGMVSQYVHGFFNIAPEAIIGGPLMAAGLQGNKGFLNAYSNGVDTGTALGLGVIDAAATYAGLKIPVKLAPSLGGLANTALSAGAFPVVGIVSRGTSSALLEANGYPEMAAQYKPLDTTAIVADMVMGAGFGALAHYGPKAAEAYLKFQERKAGEINATDLDTAATALNNAHLEVETAPGVPADPATRAAHVDYINRSLEAMINGDEHPPPPPEVVDGTFVPNPVDTAVRQAIGEAVREHLGETGVLGDLEAELARRGLPTDPSLYARGGRTGDTIENVTTAAREAFGSDGAALVDSGLMRVVESPSELPDRSDGQAHPADAQAYFDGKRVWLVAKNLSAGEVKDVVLHEVGVHVGMESMLGADLYRKLTQEVADRAAAGEEHFADAMRQVPADTPAGKVNDEALAYLVQNRPELPLVKRLLSEVKTALYRLLGGRLIKLNADDLRTLAVAALRRVSRADAVRGQAEGFYNRDVGAIERPTTPLPAGATTIEVDGVQRPAMNSNGQPIHWSQEGVRNFWRWFGDSKAVDSQGRPLVVYHGTDAKPFVIFDTMDFGSWFAERRSTASDYEYKSGAGDSRIYETYIRAKKPLYIPDNVDLSDDVKVADALSAINEYNGTTFTAADLGYRKGYQGLAAEFLALNDRFVTAVKDAGFDSMNGLEQGRSTWNVFDSTQIKSATGNRGTFDPEQGNIMYARAKPGVESPGVGVADSNINGFEPALRVRVSLGKMALPTSKSGKAQPLILTGTNLKNAARQITAIDAILERFPDADLSPLNWSRMLAYAFATNDVPIPPYRFLRDINSDGALRSLQRLTSGQIADANHGFENARAFREAYTSGELDVETTGKLFLWSFLSRGVSPYTQEGLFLDSFEGAGKWIKKAAEGTFTKADFKAYTAWAKSVAPKGAGQPGAGATHNLNAFGKLFLYKMGQRDANGASLMQKLHDLIADPNQTGQSIRRWFIENTEGVGIDNKVVSFTLLVAGFEDVMVLDRVQIRQLWDDGRFGDRNLYDGRKKNGKAVAGSALSELTYGARGLLIYEAVERALAKRIENLYTALGRPEDASIGRYHWESWVADSAQEASHGTLDAILASAKGDMGAMASITAKEGEYGGYAYGARYGRDVNGQPYFLYQNSAGKDFQFSVEAFRDFLKAVKSPKNKVIPSKFKVTESGNAPWYQRPDVNRAALDKLIQRYGELAAREPGTGEGAGAVRQDGQGQAVPDGTGPGAQRAAGTDAARLIEQHPALTVPDETGAAVPASRVLAQADAEIARAESDSPQYEAAAACFLRG